MPRVGDRSALAVGKHKLLVAMAVLAVAYCLAAPYAANVIAHFNH
ncbi:MAG TPA: hypothetical protein VGF62_03225 [Rhizomicrobium sp.]